MKDNHLLNSNNNRSRNIKILRSEIEKTLKTKDSKFWLTKFKEYNIPCSSIDKIKDVFTNPQIISRNMILNYFDNDFGEIKVVGNPIKFDGEVDGETAENAPELNEHKDEIMSYFKIKK